MAKYKDVGLAFQAVGYTLDSADLWYRMGSDLEYAFSLVETRARGGGERMKQLVRKQNRRITAGGSPELAPEESAPFTAALRDRMQIRPAMMLAAMALECYLKGRIAEDTKENAPKGHGLVALAKRSSFVFSADELDIIGRMLEPMIQLGRYFLTVDGKAGMDLSTSRAKQILHSVRSQMG
ncbi:MAG: hypothetical protein HONBIEJF_00601 [Fimbriimonadaceae bacterium]|nr:hypothetical protein [Fimbriimonadaceae bacterium]